MSLDHIPLFVLIPFTVMEFLYLFNIVKNSYNYKEKEKDYPIILLVSIHLILVSFGWYSYLTANSQSCN